MHSTLNKYTPELKILKLHLRNQFRGITTREVGIFRGENGWSEFSPFVEYEIAEAATWMKAALESAHKPWPQLFHQEIPINATLPIVEAREVASILCRFNGCRTVKIKVDDFSEGSRRVAATLEEIPDAKLRLDVNGGWNVQEAVEALENYHNTFGDVFEYVEQPCSLEQDLRELHKVSPIKIAADEAIRKNLDGELEKIREFADVAILKWQPLGGFSAAHAIANRIGLPVVISSGLESGIGISQGLALAASFVETPLACGLGTASLFTSDLTGEAMLPRGGNLGVRRVEPSNLEAFAVSEDRRKWWENRILQCIEHLEKAGEL